MAEENDRTAAGDETAAGNDKPAKGYGKRPLWQWVLIYVVVAAVLYGVVYLVFFNGGNGSGGTVY